MEELIEALEHNFEGYDMIANLVRNKTPKYGNDDDYADNIMKDVFNFYQKTVTGRPNTVSYTHLMRVKCTSSEIRR